MADNSSIPVAVGNETFANKDIAGVKFPKNIQYDSAGAEVVSATAANQALQLAQETAAAGGIGASADAVVAAGAAGSISAKARRLTTDIGALLTAFGAALTRGAGAADANTQRVTIDTGQIAANTAAGTDATALVGVQGAAGMSPLRVWLAEAANIVMGSITTAMTGTTSTSLIAAPGASLKNHITSLSVSNSHATQGTDLELQDGSGGTTFWIVPAAALYGGAIVTFNPPLRQPTANTALYCKCTTTGANVRVSANGFKAA